MKKLILLSISLGMAAFNINTLISQTNTEETIENNPELKKMYFEDQADRSTEHIDWAVVSKRDSLREKRIYELLDSNKVRTSSDYHAAAMIFQHGSDSVAYGMAVKMMQTSIDLNPDGDKWLLAAATDRYLLSKDEPQIYGTQYQKEGDDQPWKLAEMDTTQITDAQRMEFGVGTLAQQRERVKQMNRTSLSELLAELDSVEKVIERIKLEPKNDPKIDVSETSLNDFGYSLMGEGQINEALKIFILNTQMYPDAYNTWDSLGECLLVLDRTDEGIQAYKKSLELNPENTNAEEILKRMD